MADPGSAKYPRTNTKDHNRENQALQSARKTASQELIFLCNRYQTKRCRKSALPAEQIVPTNIGFNSTITQTVLQK